MNIIVNVVVKKDNKILMVQEGWGHVKGMWNFPAGHLDENENIFDGAIREAKEETGFDVKLTSLIGIQNAVYANRHVVLISFAAEIVGGEVAYNPEEIMNVDWLEVDKILSMTNSELRGVEARSETIKRLVDGKVFPIDVITNFKFDTI